MSRRSLKLQLIVLNKQIKDLETRELKACFSSATDRPHEDLGVLFWKKDQLIVQKLDIQKKLDKPTFVQIITRRKK